MMLSLKKVYREELLQLAILLSLLRVEQTDWSVGMPTVGVGGPDSWEYSTGLPDIRIHPKSLLVNQDEAVLADLTRYVRVNNLWQNVTAYMGFMNTDHDDQLASTSSRLEEHTRRLDNATGWGFMEEGPPEDLTPEDMDLIEVLWKQDVDMGFSVQDWQDAAELAMDDTSTDSVGGASCEDGPKCKVKTELEPDKPSSDPKKEEDDIWIGVSHTIDLETGEHIKTEDPDGGEEVDNDPPSSLLPQPDFSLEEALQLVGLNDDLLFLDGTGLELESGDKEDSEDSQEGLELLEEMIHGPTYSPHHRPLQGRMGYMRGGSMEQRWQDLASLLSLPEPHYLANYPHQHQHPHQHQQQQPQQPPESAAKASLHEHPHPAVTPYSPMGSGNVGSAVASSMNLMTNSSEPMGSEAGATAFKMENPQEMMYYQNGTSELTHTPDGFLSSILNDEDLQLMDMAMNEPASGGMYTMRMLEGGSGGGGGDSDSAVSSMGSERVPSLSSDTEWMETNSDSGQAPDHYQDYARSKYRWYDYGYGRPLSGEASSGPRGGAGPPVAQKKHHMYGKRIFHDQPLSGGNLTGGGGAVCGGGLPLKAEYPAAMSPALAPNYPVQPELKFSCSVEFSRQTLTHPVVRSNPSQIAAHNHTYHMMPEDCGAQQRPLARDKKGRKSEEETHLTRDERRARSLSIPMSVDDIINLPMDEFNERLSKYDLSENQLSLIRDIRRRGKNKVAAQNCRKRKLDQILSLADEVKHMRERKQRLLHERQVLASERHRIKNKFSQLYRHIFQSLRDGEGNPYSPYEWSLQQAADGSVVLVPRGNQTLLDQTDPLRKPSSHQP